MHDKITVFRQEYSCNARLRVASILGQLAKVIAANEVERVVHLHGGQFLCTCSKNLRDCRGLRNEACRNVFFFHHLECASGMSLVNSAYDISTTKFKNH